MSEATIKPTKTTKKPKQKFIRLNLDDKLEALLQKYESKYTLLSRSDIIRMLLSEVNWVDFDSKDNSKKKFISFLNNLPKPRTDFSEEEIFEFLEA